MIYLFDVDGTLTPARATIDPDFEQFFLSWMKDKEVYLVSGSDYAKSVEQVGEIICENVSGCFNTAGNTFFQKGVLQYKNEWKAEKPLLAMLQKYMDESKFPLRRGRHFEHRIGMLNFSIIGRNCSREERNRYFEYDNVHHERETLQQMIMQSFPEIEVTIGGQISIDIYPEGKNKGQIVSKFNDSIHFFGDKTLPGGNDYDIAKKLQKPPHRVTQVQNWQETLTILKNIK